MLNIVKFTHNTPRLCEKLNGESRLFAGIIVLEKKGRKKEDAVRIFPRDISRVFFISSLIFLALALIFQVCYSRGQKLLENGIINDAIVSDIKSHEIEWEFNEPYLGQQEFHKENIREITYEFTSKDGLKHQFVISARQRDKLPLKVIYYADNPAGAILYTGKDMYGNYIYIRNYMLILAAFFVVVSVAWPMLFSSSRKEMRPVD